MTVEQFINKLQSMPKDSDVCVYSEGCCFHADIVYESNCGDVILTSNYETVSDIDCFPKDKSIGLHRNGFVYFQENIRVI